MSKINTDRIGTRDGTLDIDVKSIMVRSDAMENLGVYEQGIELAHAHEFIVKGDSWYTAKTGQVPYVLTGVWEYDKERLEIYGAWDHSSLKNRDKEGSHSAGAITYEHGTVFPDKSLGKELQTLKNNSSDYQIVDSFEQGATITERNQALQVEADGRLYRWAGDLPKTVAAGSSPETTGGAQVGAWLEVSDLTLRQDLANPDKGAAMVAFGKGTLADAVNNIRVSANDYGASTAAHWQTNRAAIQAANDAAASRGGATVTLTPGTYEVKGIIQDSRVIFDFNGVTLRSPDGLAPVIITSRTTDCSCDIETDSNVVTITSGDASGIEIGTRVGIVGAGGILDSQVTTLTTPIDATSTTLTLTNATGLYPNAPLLIDDEIITFTSVSRGVLSGVVRGAFGTTPAPHTASAPIGVARRLIATVIHVDGNSITLDRPSLKSATGVDLTYGVISSGIVGLPTIDCNKQLNGAPSSVYGVLFKTASMCGFDLRIINGDVGGIMFSNGSAYNYGKRIFLHDCGVPEGGRGGSFWLYQGCENNHFDHIEVTGKVWVGVYLDDRTTSSDAWNAPNNNNTFVTTNINVTESATAPLNIVSGQGNRFLGGNLTAPRVGISISDNSQGTGGGVKSIGNHFDNFTIDVSEYPYLVYSAGNTLSNINVKRGRLAPIVAAGNCLYAISPVFGAPPIMPKGYRINALPYTRLADWTGWEIPETSGVGEAGGVIDLSDTVSTYNPIAYNAKMTPASPGETWACAVDVTVPEGYPSVQLRAAIVSYRKLATGTLVLVRANSGPALTIKPGETVRCGAFMVLTPDLTEGLRIQVQMMSEAASGRRIVISKPVIEKDTITVQSLFDGDTDGAMWLGEPGASQSILL